jgi:hypothetical protein
VCRAMMRTTESGHYAAGDRRVGRHPSPYLAHAKVSVPPYLIAKWKESGCPDSFRSQDAKRIAQQ